MKAVLINEYGPGTVMSIEEVDRPTAEGKLVLVEVYASSVNPIDWKIRNGEMEARYGQGFPKILGCDLSGKVLEVGPEVTKYKPGEAVFSRSDQIPGKTYAEFAVIGEDALARKPRSISHMEAAAMPLATITAYQGLKYCGQIQTNDRILIIGASGGVGTYAIQLAKSMGAHVTAVCSGTNADLVKELGADEVIDYTCQDVFVPGTTYDAVYDVVGSYSLEKARNSLTPKGVYMTLVPTDSDIEFFIHGKTERQNGHGYFVICTPDGKDLEEIANLSEAGSLRTVIDSVFPLDEIVAAHERSETLRARGKIVLRVKG